MKTSYPHTWHLRSRPGYSIRPHTSDVLRVYFYTALLFVLQSVKDLFLLLPRHCPAASLPRSEPRAFPKASAKVQPFLELAKLLASFFAILCIFLDDSNFHGALSLYIFTRAREMGRLGVNKSTSQQVYESTSQQVYEFF